MPKATTLDPSRVLQVVPADPHTPPTATAPEVCRETLEVTLAGRRYRLVSIDEDGDRDVALAGVLTARELQVVALVADGQPNKIIADRLQISEWTVSTHLRRIFAKLRVDTRAAMVSRCLELVRRNR